jgi:streptogrisin C
MNKQYVVGLAAVSLLSLGGYVLAQDFAGHAADVADGAKHAVVARGAKRQTEAESLLQDLSLVAKAKGWTLAEARADYMAAEEIGAIAAQLAERRPDIFIGSVLSPKPGGRPSLYVKGVADQAVYDLIADARVKIDVVDRQPYSFAELEHRNLQVHNMLAEQGFDEIATSFDFQKGGQIQAMVARKPGLPEFAVSVLAELPATLRDSVDLVISDKPVAQDFYAYGGMAVHDDGAFECTAGWSVVNGSGTTGVTTAGHCTGINQIMHPGIGLHAMTHQAEHRGQWGDIEWKTTVALESPEFYATATSIRDVTSIEPRASISVGESICFYGRSSNNRDCSLDVAATSVSCTVNGVFNNRLVRMNGNSAIPGDSGGGWSFNFRAYGSVKGICGGGSVFSVADLYDEALGVTVRTL